MADDLMLDPSLFLSPRTFRILLDAMKSGELSTSRIPASFGAILSEGQFSDSLLGFFGDSEEPLSATEIRTRILEAQVKIPASYRPAAFRLRETEFDIGLFGITK